MGLILKSAPRLKSELSRLKALGGLKINPAKHHVASTPHWVLARRGRARLLYYKADTSHKSVFIVPSLINSYTILDLFPGSSLVEALIKEGINVYLLDWGNPREQDQFATLEDHILNWLAWAHQLSCDHAGISSLPIFGQCIGGTLAAIYAAIYPERVSALAFLTTPIDFQDAGILSHWARSSTINLAAMSEVWGNISGGFLSRSFKLIEPLGDVRKYQFLFKYGVNPEFLKKYVAMESWLKEAIHFPGPSYAKFIQDLYRDNRLVKKNFRLNDQLVDLANISCPILNLYAPGDVIVPSSSSLRLSELVSSQVMRNVPLKGGHIGCLISDKHQKNLWRELSQWLNAREFIPAQEKSCA